MQPNFGEPPEIKVYEISEDGASQSVREVLLLEDEGKLTEILQIYLESNGYHVTSVDNGVEGLKNIMAMNFDVILCDMMMPNLAGDMFYTAVERTKPHLCKRFIFMTGHKGDQKIEEFIRKVRGVMLWKPFRLHDMLEAMQVVIDRNASV